MKDTHHKIFQEYSPSIIGLPYSSFDCYDIVKIFYDLVFDIELSGYSYDNPLDKDNMEFLIASQKSKFNQVSKPEFGDIILLKVQGVPCHLGIYLWKTKFIHTTVETGSIIDDTHYWKNKIEGFYRHG